MNDEEWKKIKDELKNNKKLRESLNAELEAINLYEEIREETDDEHIKELFEHIIEEEKHHVSELYHMLNVKDKEQFDEHESGLEEIEDIIGKQSKKGRGWHNDPIRHSLASQGVKTAQKRSTRRRHR